MTGPIADPGWGPTLRTLPKLFVPFVGMRTMAGQSDGLTALRMLWCVFAGALILVWIPVAIAAPELDGQVSVFTALIVVVAIGVSTQLAARMLGAGHDVTDASRFVASFQRTTLVRVALAEAAAIVGFVGFLLSGSAIIYGVGFAIAAYGHFDAMPASRRLGAAQQQVDEAGGDWSVVGALVSARLTR